LKPDADEIKIKIETEAVLQNIPTISDGFDGYFYGKTTSSSKSFKKVRLG
jgi:hypothetical protein